MTLTMRLSRAVVLMLVAATTLAAQQAERRLTRVPAPIGAGGATQELYSGSYALLVGLSKYDHPEAWASLDTVPREMNELATALRQSGFDQVEQLSNPTGQELRRAVEDFIGRYGYDRGNRLLLFFSGHGFSLDQGERGFFVPRDAPDPTTNEASFRRTALSMQQVATWAQDLTAKHALFAFDSCFSGTIFRTRDRIVPARISELTAKPVRQFLSAGGAGEPVPARSVFTPSFIRALRGEADLDKDGFVTGTELGNYVQREVIAYKTRQTPQFGKIRDPQLDEGDVVFAVPRVGDAPARPTPSATASSSTFVAPTPAAPTPASAPTTAGPPATAPTTAEKAQSAIEALRSRRYQDAVNIFQEVVAVVPNCGDCFYNIGIAHSSLKQWGDAERAFKRALEINPQFADAYSGLASVYNEQRRFDEAAAASRRAAELSGAGGNAETLYNQGVILFNAGKFDEARQQFERAVAVNPNLAEAHFQLAMTLLNGGRLQEARTSLGNYLRVAPNGPKAAEARSMLAQLK